MSSAYLSEVVGEGGVFSLLNELFQNQGSLHVDAFEASRQQLGITPEASAELLARGLFAQHGNDVAMSTTGQRTTLLLRAINDKDELSDTIRRLAVLFPYLRPFDLVRGNITEYVLDLIDTRRDFIRLFLCSPWIRLKEPLLNRLRSAITAVRQKYPQLQILVITLPLDRYRDPEGIATVRALQSLGATVVTHRKLHAKLYISDPGPLGGAHYAVFGSENLTGANQIELALKVENDNEMLGRLTNFFYEIETEASLLAEVSP